MKFNISTQTMKKILNIVSKIPNMKSTTKIYSSILLETKNDTLEIRAKNNFQSIRIIEKDNVEIFEDGSCFIESKLLIDLIKNIDDVSLEFQVFDNALLNIKTINSVYKINVFNPDNLHKDSFEKREEIVNFKSDDFKRMTKHIIYAIDNSGINPIITGLNLKLDKDIIRTFSTDSFRLANSHMHIDNSIISNIIIPKQSIKDINSFIDENDIEDLEIDIFDDCINIFMNNISLKILLIEGIYPRSTDVENFINSNQSILKIDKSKFEKIIKRLMIFSDDESKSILLSFQENKILFENNSNMYGNGIESLNLEDEIKQSFNILVSGRFLIESLKNCSNNINLIVEGENDPIIIDDKDYSTSHLIIPLNN